MSDGATRARAASRRLLLLGPGPEQLGGMASVVAQMRSLDWAGRYACELLPMTTQPAGGQGWLARCARHAGHARRLWATLREGGPTVVHVHTCSGFSFYRSCLDMLIAQGCGAAVVLHVHGAYFHEFYAGAGPVGRAAIRWGLQRADAVIALSAAWRDRLLAMGPRARVVVVENAVAVPAAVERGEGGSGGACHFVLLARMDTWKGVDDLLAATAKARSRADVRVTLAGPAGSAGDADALAAKAAAAGVADCVRYVGSVEGAAKQALLQSADVYIQPSHHEGLPIALLEALAAGLPVVATRVGAVPEVVTPGCEGLLVPARSPEELADAMVHVAASPSERRAMGRAAHGLARRRFSLARFEADLLQLYATLEREQRHPARLALQPGVRVREGL